MKVEGDKFHERDNIGLTIKTMDCINKAVWSMRES